MKRILVPVAVLFLGACAAEGPKSQPPTVLKPDVPQTAEAAALAAALQQIQAKSGEYKISGADLIEITVYQQPEMTRKLRVNQTGAISLPLIGVVQIGGLSIIDAQAALAERFKDFLVNPQITIFIHEYGNKKIIILGEVQKPGSYELPAEKKLTVLEALALAGGFTPIAAPDRTKVIRQVNGQNQSIPVQVSAITKNGEKDKDIALEPNDVIFVPQSYF